MLSVELDRLTHCMAEMVRCRSRREISSFGVVILDIVGGAKAPVESLLWSICDATTLQYH